MLSFCHCSLSSLSPCLSLNSRKWLPFQPSYLSIAFPLSPSLACLSHPASSLSLSLSLLSYFKQLLQWILLPKKENLLCYQKAQAFNILNYIFPWHGSETYSIEELLPMPINKLYLPMISCYEEVSRFHCFISLRLLTLGEKC